MNKQSLLAASVLLGLVGCGGDSDNNSASTDSVTLTAFDGYLSNALVFIDQNNDSQWNSGERILGLTNDAGQLTLGSRPDGVIAVQTLTPNGLVQQQLANDHPEYNNIYTIDMDRPAQPITYELVLKTPASSNTLSPLTDLVVLEMAAGATESQAIENINNALGKNISPYSNYLDGNEADAELHKLAQILTETKGNNGVDEYAQNRLNVITKAQQLVDEIVSDNILDIEDKNYIPTIEIANDNSLSNKVNHRLVTNQSVANDVDNTLAALIIDENFSGTTIPLNKDVDGHLVELFSDADQAGAIAVTITNSAELAAAGLNVILVSSAIEITPNSNNLLTGDYRIQLQANDLDANGLQVGTSQAIFTTKVRTSGNNQLPSANTALTASLQAQIDSNWSFKVGTPISNMTLDIGNLFTDPEGDTLKFGTRPRLTYAYLERGIDVAYSSDHSTITLSGTPTDSAIGGTMSIDVQDHHHGHGEWTTVELNLPNIAQ